MVLGCALISGCGGDDGPRQGDALDLGRTEGTTCVPSGSDPKTFGEMDLENVSDDDIIIRRVTLAGADGLRLVGAGVVPVNDISRVVANGWPPTDADLQALWQNEGADPEGYTVRPGAVVGVWAGVDAPDGGGTAVAVRIEYTSGDTDYYQDGVEQIELRDSASCI